MSSCILLECRPDSYRQWYQKGEEFRRDGYLQEALFCYNKAIEYYPGDYYAWYYRGKVLEEMGDYSQAVTSWRVACQIKPDNYWGWYEWGCLLQDKLDKLQEAEFCFLKALTAKPDDYWTNYRLARVNISKKKYLVALDYLNKCLRLRPRDYWSYYWQGFCRQQLDQWCYAKCSYQEALRIKPGDYWTIKQLAAIAEKECSYREAIGYYRQLLSLGEEEGTVYQKLATYSLILGDKSTAELYQQKLAAIKSHSLFPGENGG